MEETFFNVIQAKFAAGDNTGSERVLHAGWLALVRPDMILDNCRASAGQKPCLKSTLSTGTDGEGREATVAATEGGGEGLPQRGDGPSRAGHGDSGESSPVTWGLYIVSARLCTTTVNTDCVLPSCISRI